MAKTDDSVPQEELILLIHGTFASDHEDEGPRWWQVGSDFWKYFEKRFPKRPRMQRIGEVFHWDGLNTERSRRFGARALLKRLQELEAQEVGYHLICHSHGGSVLWSALKMSLQEGFLRSKLDPKRPRLKNLKSWATMGTPFIHYEQQPELSGARRFLCFFLIGMGVLGFATAVATPFFGLSTLHSLYVLMAATSLIVIPGGLGVLLWTPFLEAGSVRRELKREKQALTFYGDLWLGIWSSEDEAINGLKVAVDSDFSLIPEYSSGVGVYTSDRWKRLAEPVRAFVSWIFNRLIRSRLDRWVVRSIKRYMQGNDRPGIEITTVASTPSLQLRDLPPLPKDIHSKLKRTADGAAKRKIPQLRSLIGQAATSGAPLHLMISQNGSEAIFSGAELIHTSYYQSETIREIIALHVASRSHLDLKLHLSKAHREWANRFRQEVNRTF